MGTGSFTQSTFNDASEALRKDFSKSEETSGATLKDRYASVSDAHVCSNYLITALEPYEGTWFPVNGQIFTNQNEQEIQALKNEGYDFILVQDILQTLGGQRMGWGFSEPFGITDFIVLSIVAPEEWRDHVVLHEIGHNLFSTGGLLHNWIEAEVIGNIMNPNDNLSLRGRDVANYYVVEEDLGSKNQRAAYSNANHGGQWNVDQP